MDDEDAVVFIDHEDHLQQSAITATAPYQPPSIVPMAWIRTLGIPDDQLGLIRGDTMRANMLDIPCVPSEIHAGSSEFFI
jgi:hypothetical protein